LLIQFRVKILTLRVLEFPKEAMTDKCNFGISIKNLVAGQHTYWIPAKAGAQLI